MKQLAVFILGLCAGLVLLAGCKKYPEGPALSLRSKKERVAGTWKLDKVLSGGVDSTAYFTNYFIDYTVVLTRSGGYTISYDQQRSFGMFGISETGDWSFSSDKEDLQITPKFASYGTLPSPYVLQIMKLYEKELWLRSFYGNGVAKEYHFSPK